MENKTKKKLNYYIGNLIMIVIILSLLNGVVTMVRLIIDYVKFTLNGGDILANFSLSYSLGVITLLIVIWLVVFDFYKNNGRERWTKWLDKNAYNVL
ncbi:MAG: hypothetical protein ACFFCM_07485 [Promethearchaeota archaeon]